ncbi:LOW QUALITY PROTEIN: protein POF1B [Physeter macrocephalus]|uniref:LOW QUALITY PROTEIN: protein POF1B n=1 Tax=Physeter macrocephalus TaxID=9755 RepID=A0A9W2WED8_PHYMC|nr:LOW QUALITY PROTEIN: protein POF1B [Physeter catodon]
MMSSNYWSEMSSSSCGTQQSPEMLQCQPQHYHCYHQSSQAQQPPEKNVVYERVRTYSRPMNKVVEALDTYGSREVCSPLRTASSYQSLLWRNCSQELHSPTLKISTCAPITLHITPNTEQELHSPTVKVTTYPQTTIRQYVVQNPEQENSALPGLETKIPTPENGRRVGRGDNLPPHKYIRNTSTCGTTPKEHLLNVGRRPQTSQKEPLLPFLRGGHFFPGNNVIYEKTIRKVEKLNTDQLQPNSLPASRGALAPSGCFHSATSRPFPGIRLKPEAQLPAHARPGGKQDFESTDESEDIESLIPKGLSEFTKQQICYILQMRGMSDKSLRLVVSTFSNIREELGHLQNDLTSLENDKIRLEKDLAFKETQIKEYEELLASVRANNRQQQHGLQDSTSKCQALEENNLSLRHTLSDIEYKLKELEYCKRNLEQENKNLRVQLSETCTGPMLQAKMDEIGNHYMEMVKNLRMEKDREICKLRTQLNQYQKDVSRREGSCSDFQFKIHELTSLLEEKDSLIKHQSEELSQLRQEIYSSHNQPSSGGRTTITTRTAPGILLWIWPSACRYRSQYPILDLLFYDYEYIPPGSDTQTIVIEKTEDKWTCP